MACQIIRCVGQFVLDITGKGSGCHFHIAVPITAVFFTFFSHAYRITVKISFRPSNLRSFLRLHPEKHTLKNFQPFPFTFGNYPAGNILLKCADLFHRAGFAGQKCFPQDCVGFHLFLIAIPFQRGKNRGIQPACRIFPGAFCLCFRALCCLFRCFRFILHGVNEFLERRIEAGLF